MQQKRASTFITVGMISAILISLTMTTTSCGVLGQSQKQSKGFVHIFDGKTLNGWEGDPTYWRAENGSLVGEITPSTLLKTNNFIIWQGGKPGDFELMCDFKITKAGNSGINYRSEQVAGIPHALRGYQADIDGANRYTGQNYEERARTTLAYRGEKSTIKPFSGSATSLRDYVKNNNWTERTVTGSLGTSEELQTKIKQEDWNTCRIVAKGNHLQHYINGILMSDVTDNDAVNGKSEGLLGVQVHVGPPMKVEYRNIMLKQ
ncbi:MAG: 3-keto-disaccharide hydrolase [Segetibacter sp.]